MYKRQIYQISESNRIEKIDSVARIKSNRIETFLPELECSTRAVELSWSAVKKRLDCAAGGRVSRSVRVSERCRRTNTPTHLPAHRLQYVARASRRPPSPKLGSQENSWLRRWAKYTSAWFGSQISLITAMSFPTRAKKFRFDSIRQSDKFAACTLIFK